MTIKEAIEILDDSEFDCINHLTYFECINTIKQHIDSKEQSYEEETEWYYCPVCEELHTEKEVYINGELTCPTKHEYIKYWKNPDGNMYTLACKLGLE